MVQKKRSNILLKIAIAVAVLVVLGFLFIRSLQSTRSEPYSVEASHLRNWRLTLERDPAPNAPLLTLTTGLDLASGLFRQLFQRAMESMNTPTTSSIPIVLRGEFDRGLAGRMTADGLLAAAREAGLESASHQPRCLAHRRISQPGDTRQVYFAVMDSPAIVTFREQLAAAGVLDAPALSPIMVVGASDASFNRWLPIKADGSDCVAPIEVR